MSAKPEVRVLGTPAELFQAAAERFAALAKDAVRNRGRFTVALSGGSTPKGLFSLLAKGTVPGIPWQDILFFWGDERYVPPDYSDSNYRMANETLLSKVPVRAENIFRVHSEEVDAGVVAKAYEQDLAKAFQLKPGEFPGFDLILLGMGPDGHTASLFPGTQALQEGKRLVVANWVEKFKTFRITFTFPVLNAAAYVMFLVAGQDKAEAVRQVFAPGEDGPPAKKVRPHNGELVWLLDRPAADTASLPKVSDA